MIKHVVSNIEAHRRNLATTTEPLTNYEEVLYYGELKIGTDSQTMLVNFDTGSSILWIPTVDCTLCTLTPSKYDYGTGGGSFLGTFDEIEYLDGTIVEGEYMSVKVELNGLVIPSMKILAAHNYRDNNMQTNVYDGICGMSVEVLSGKEDLLVDALKTAGKISSRVFSFHLNIRSKDSYIFFGG